MGPARQFLHQPEPCQQVVVALAGGLGHAGRVVDGGVFGGRTDSGAVCPYVVAQLGDISLCRRDLGEVAGDGKVEIGPQSIVMIDGVQPEVAGQPRFGDCVRLLGGCQRGSDPAHGIDAELGQIGEADGRRLASPFAQRHRPETDRQDAACACVYVGGERRSRRPAQYEATGRPIIVDGPADCVPHGRYTLPLVDEHGRRQRTEGGFRILGHRCGGRWIVEAQGRSGKALCAGSLAGASDAFDQTRRMDGHQASEALVDMPSQIGHA